LRTYIEIPYALRAGAIVHVSEVDRGLDCGCVCGRCGNALIARKGAFRQHHFAHQGDSDCLGAAESLLHRLAKELLSNAESLALPAYIYRAKSKPRFGIPPVSIEREILAASRVSISSVAVEMSLGPIVPDLLLRSDEGDLILEIAVSHRVDRSKLRHIRRMDIPALELSLAAEDVLLSRDELLQRLIEETSIKSWLFHPAQRSAEADWIKARRRRSRQPRIVHSRIDVVFAKLRSRKRDNSNWWRQNQWAEQFYRKHGRYPSLEENKTFQENMRGR
jgi:Competence protein CoiA-like family